MSPDVSIIVVSFNTRGMTLECLRSIYDQTRRTNFEVIVVDNASIDGSADAIAAAFPGVTLVRLPSNVGFAVANNLAASHHARGQYLLLLNPDTQVLDGAVDTLVDFAKANPGAGIWGGRTLNADRSLNPGSCWRQMTLLSLLCSATGLTRLFPSSPILSSESYGGWKRDSVREVDIVTGCLLLITRRLWNELDGFDPAFFMYGEEADLCLRAAACGARPMITPDASIIHYSNTSDVVHPEKMVGILKAKITLIRCHWPASRRWLGKLLFVLSPLTRAIVYSVAAKLSPGQHATRVADSWTEIWRRRGEWYPGYPAGRQT